MLAALNRPIITDYVPPAKPPWMFLALAVGLMSIGVPHDYLGVVYGLLGVSVVCFWAAGRHEEPADQDQKPNSVPTDASSRTAY